MKETPDAILRPEQAAWLERAAPPRDQLLTVMEAHAAAAGVPICDPEVGRLLGILARAAGCGRILEIGTAIGYGTLWLARSAPNARIVTIDPDRERLAAARGYLESAGVLERVELVEGEAIPLLPSLQGPWDLVWIDAVKQEYRRYLDLSLPTTALGGILAFDNMLWKGRVADPPAEADPDADAIRAFTGYLSMHPQLDAQILPIGDGVGLAVKTGLTIMERGGPF